MVRESIQNSLDAVQDRGMPVHVVFRWKRLTEANCPGLFSIRNHFQECINFWNNQPAKDKFEPKIRYIDENAVGGMFCLEVSDSNTSGMDYRPEDHSCPFYSFVRSAGNSSKAMNSAGGSYGFGKAAYYNVSRISTVLVSTQTPAGKNFFEGVCSICTHKYEGKKRTHVGYYDNNDGEPVTDIDRIPKRFKRDEPGTSVFIAGVDQNEGYKDIVSAVLTHFWLSILEGKLTVSIKLNNEGNLFTAEEALDYGLVSKVISKREELK